MLRLDQLEQTHAPVSSAVAALFDSTPGSLRDAVGVNDFIDHHRAGFNLFRNSTYSCDIFCPDAGSQTIDAVICQLDSFGFRFECHDRKHRTKSLLAHYCHIVIDIREHGGFVEETIRLRCAASAGKNVCAALLGI